MTTSDATLFLCSASGPFLGYQIFSNCFTGALSKDDIFGVTAFESPLDFLFFQSEQLLTPRFSQFIVTYNFSAMETAMSRTGLTVGFYGGIAVVGWFYQILFMPETKDKTLEEIDLVFNKPTSQLVRENIASSKKTVSDILHGRWRQVFLNPTPRRQSIYQG